MPDAKQLDAPAARKQTEAEYRASKRINWSSLKLLEKSPQHYKAGYGEESDAFALGTAVHMAVLEPLKFLEEYIVTDIRRDERTKAWQEFSTNASRNGKTILIKSEMDRVIAMHNAVMAKPRAVEYLSGGESEVGMEWELAGFSCKGRADYVGPLATVDLKTTQCASPKAFAASCLKFGYYGQAAWYADGRALSTGQRLPFVFIAVESAPPHIVTVFTVPDDLLEYGRNQYSGLLGQLDYCTKRNWWTGYVEGPEVALTLPTWAGQ